MNPKWQMFCLSFTALFLELMVIRWVPSVITLIAYYANLMLLSSFLGLGIGAMTARFRVSLFDWFPLFVAGAVATFLWCRGATLNFASAELRFYSADSALVNAAVLILIFAANAVMFVPLGQRMGRLFEAMPRLPAYGWDLAGSLAGTIAFGWFALQFFSPVVGLGIVLLIAFGLVERRRWLMAGVSVAIIGVMAAVTERGEIWSPYHHVTLSRIDRPNAVESAPPADLRTMRNPPIYIVKVNQLGYHFDGTLDLSRYDPGSVGAAFIARAVPQYWLPYQLGLPYQRVLVVGAGGGADVEAGLAMGARQIDAVEIDPVIVDVSRQFHAGAPYDDPRVTLHTDDARAFLQRASPTYDLVIFGYLDSQALFSSMTNVRLDGYVYTVESLRAAFAALNERGALVLSFSIAADWLPPKLYQMVTSATGREPAMYTKLGQLVLVVTKDPAVPVPNVAGDFWRGYFERATVIDQATDDWPYLYLSRRTIPGDYLLAIGSLLAISILAVLALRGRGFGRDDVHFALLGAGFMLMETRSISDCTLYFGATWFVTLAVVCGVLVMVIAANLVATRLRAFSPWFYLPLGLALAVLMWAPPELILRWSLVGRLAWTVLVVPLPIFFAGLIFSTTFREAKSAATAFGSNLIGAMVGGFAEYLAMATGRKQLVLLVLAAYLGSLLIMRRRR